MFHLPGCLFGLALYFLPTLIACGRGLYSRFGILMVNLFLGWTFVGWVAALSVLFAWSAYGSRTTNYGVFTASITGAVVFLLLKRNVGLGLNSAELNRTKTPCVRRSEFVGRMKCGTTSVSGPAC